MPQLSNYIDLDTILSSPDHSQPIPENVEDIVAFLKAHGTNPDFNYQILFTALGGRIPDRSVNGFREFSNNFETRSNTASAQSLVFCNKFQECLALVPSLSLVDYL